MEREKPKNDRDLKNSPEGLKITGKIGNDQEFYYQTGDFFAELKTSKKSVANKIYRDIKKTSWKNKNSFSDIFSNLTTFLISSQTILPNIPQSLEHLISFPITYLIIMIFPEIYVKLTIFPDIISN